MVDMVKEYVEANEIVEYLKQEVRFKEIYRKILVQRIIVENATEKGLTVTPEDVQEEANKRRYTQRLEKAADTLAWLDEQMISESDWEAGIEVHIFAKKLADHLFADQVEQYYAQHKLDYEQVALYQIIVPYEKVAKELFYQIEEKEISFYEAAHLYDMDERRRLLCGCEGKVYRWSLQADVASVVFSANPAEVTYPLKTEQGYHLFLVEEFIPAELNEGKIQEITNKLFQEWLKGELNYVLHNKLEEIESV